jgi:hypothetical protein
MPHFRTHSKAKTPDPDVIQVVPDVNIESFYDSELEEVPAPARKLLEGYSKVPPEDVYPLILQVV